MAELIATGSTQFDSADFTVAVGGARTLFIKNTGGAAYNGVQFILQHKTPAATYVDVQQLDASNIVAFGNIVGSGTYRVRRMANSTGQSAGMDIEG